MNNSTPMPRPEDRSVSNEETDEAHLKHAAQISHDRMLNEINARCAIYAAKGKKGVVPRVTQLTPNWISAALDTPDPSRTALTRIINDMKIREVPLRDRLGEFMEALSDDDIAGLHVYTNGIKFTVDSTVLLELHAWVPTKKTLKSSYRNRTYISQEDYDRIPNDVHKFLASGTLNALLSLSYTRNGNVRDVATNEYIEIPRYTTSLIDYSAIELVRSPTGDKILIEIHEYRPRMSAVQLVIPLTK